MDRPGTEEVEIALPVGVGSFLTAPSLPLHADDVTVPTAPGSRTDVLRMMG